MKIAIQRRSIYLCPIQGLEATWLYQQFDRPEIYDAFGFPAGARRAIRTVHREGRVVLGLIRRAVDQRRIGFVCMFAPSSGLDFWEFAYSITHPADRDAFSAMHSMDAIAHYMIDHRGIAPLGGRTREDNRAARAIAQRVGYQRYDMKFIDGHNYLFFRLDRERWARRRAQLDRGEAERPSGTGGTFVALTQPPYVPVVPSGAQAET